MQSPNEALNAIPEVRALFAGADVIDIKSMQANITLRQLIAGVLSYQPGWMTFLYRVRWGFVRLLGLTQDGVPSRTRIRPDNVPCTPGDRALFFVVRSASEDRFWIATTKDEHLDADLAFVVGPDDGEARQCYVITGVHFNKPIGRFYFRFIEPFHHLIVRLAMRSAVKEVNAAAAPMKAVRGRAG